MNWERTPLNVASSFGNNADPNSVLATLITFGVLFVVGSALTILIVCACCEIYRKAGVVKCWKALIPFYNLFLLCKLTWSKASFWIFIVIDVLAVISFALGLFVCKYCFLVFGLMIAIQGILSIILTYKVCKSFGHGIGWTIGLILIFPVFLPMLAFGKSKYIKHNKSHIAN